MSKLFALVGKDIDYSFSRAYFAQKFENENLHDHSYVNWDMPVIDHFAEFLAKNPNIKGLNVTIPYKQTILDYLPKISKNALAIGAVNTIRRTKKGQLKGYNTDWYGFYHSLVPLLQEHHTKALVLGTGGASKAILFALDKLGIQHLSVSRTPNEQQISYDQITQQIMQEYSLIINTTPLGTFPNVQSKVELPYDLITTKHLVYDLIYNPSETAMLQAAKQKGAQIKNGLQMLELQAERAFEIWNK